MSQFFSALFSHIFGNNIILATIFISMVPVVELRGAIPFATNTQIWKNLALSNWQAFGWSLLGSCLIVPVLAGLFLPIIKWLKSTKVFKKFAIWIENIVKNKAKSNENAENVEKLQRFTKKWWKRVIETFIFVAVPLPFTGVWTGTCVAVFIGLDFLTSCITVILGNIVAGLLITLILQFFPWLNNWLIYVFIALVVIILLYIIIKAIIHKAKSKNEIKD